MLTIKRITRKKLKWGIAGCGRFSENAIIPSLLLLRRSSITSVFSNDITRAKNVAEKSGIQKYFCDYDEFLKSDIDVVYIGSANYHHYNQVIKAAAAGKHILCEKPVALTSAEAEKMVKACEDAGVQFAVNYPYRFHPLVLKSKQFIDEQKIGKLTSISISFNIDLPPGTGFRYDIDKSGGGSLRDLGTHVLDLLRFFGGDAESVTGYMDNLVYGGDVDDCASGIVKFVQSGYGYFNVSFNNKRAFNRIEILGHTGAIALDYVIANKLHPSQITLMFNGEARKAFRKKTHILMNLLKSVQKSFLKNETPLVTGHDGLVNMKLMEQLESNAAKKRIS